MNICSNIYNIQNPYLSSMLTIKNLSLLQNEFSKRSMAMMLNQKNLAFPMNPMMGQPNMENKKVKTQDSPINMLASTQPSDKQSGAEETTLTPIRKPNLILSTIQDKDLLLGKSMIPNKKIESQSFIPFLNKDLILNREEVKHDSESTEALSEADSKSSNIKKRRFNELGENAPQGESVESEKARREKEINALIDKYNFMISEKKRINKEKRKESKKKRGRLRKLAQDENGNDDEISEELPEENGK